MKSEPQYILERWPHGWLICSAPGISGIPVTALSECKSLFPKNSVMAAGIVHHYNASGYSNHDVVWAVGVETDLRAWERQILDSIKHLNPQLRWWRGVDVGKSSAAMFAALSNDAEAGSPAQDFGGGATPRDADDFGRCKRLIDAFPEWRDRLREVASAYPDTKWPAIITRWDEIVAAKAERKSEILRTL